MPNISINAKDFDHNSGFDGYIKDINGVNGAPLGLMPGFGDLQDQFNQMGVSHLRFHDMFGLGDIENTYDVTKIRSIQLLTSVPDKQKARAARLIQDFTTIRSIFPNANIGMAKRDRELALSNPNWAPTDYFFRKTLENIPSLNPGNIERNILFRIGRTNGGGNIPPADFDIYADLVGEVVRRYSRDYAATGLPRKVSYWQVWNEPDLREFWGGSAYDYYRMYEKVARRVKEIDPSALVGGPSVADGLNSSGRFTKGFLAYCRSNGVPLDFFAWHYYAHLSTDPLGFKTCADGQRALLDSYGYTNVPNFCTEWNITPFASISNSTKVQSYANAAFIAASFITMNKCSISKAYYYRGDESFMGLYNDEDNPNDRRYKNFCTSAAQAFGLYKDMFGTPNLLKTPDLTGQGVYVLAGVGDNAVNILVSRFKKDLKLADPSKGPPDGKYFQQHYVDSNRMVSQITDDWSREHYFGIDPGQHWHSVAPRSITEPTVTTAISGDAADKHVVGLTSSNANGITLQVAQLPRSYARLEVRRTKKNSPLTSIRPEVDNTGVTVNLYNDSIEIDDALTDDYSVTLYSIILR